MTFLKRIRRMLGGSTSPDHIPNNVKLNDLLERARTAQYAEDYTTCMALLEDASAIAEAEHDTRAKVDIALSRADTLMAQGDLKTADFVLRTLREDAESRGMNAPLSYALSSLGVLATQRDNWDTARSLFEQARERAETIQTDGAAGRAMGHLAEVYAHEGNASYAVYLLQEAIPRLNESGDRELLGHFYCVLGKAQIASGQQSAGLNSLQQGLAQAQALKHRAQMRQLALELGKIALEAGHFQRAQGYFTEALRYFPDPPPKIRETARTFSQMSRAALGADHVEQALQKAEQAVAIAETLDDPVLLAEARAALGIALHSIEDYEQAHDLLQQAAATFEQQDATPHVIDVLRMLAKIEAHEGQMQSARATFDKALARAADLPFSQAQVHSNLADFLMDQGQIRKALSHWQEAMTLYKDSGHHAQVARTLCDIAASYDALGDGRMARREYGRALEMLSRIDDVSTRGVVLANVAAAYCEYGDLETAEDFFKEAIGIAEKTNMAQAAVLRRANYGRLLALTGRGQEALAMLTKALTLSEANDFELQAAVIVANTGLAHADLGQSEQAIAHYERALDRLNALDDPQTIQWRAVVHCYLGQQQRNADLSTQAAENFAQSLKLAQQSAHLPMQADAQIGLAQHALDEGDLERAQTQLNDANPIAKHLQYVRIQARLHAARSRYFALNNDADNAQSAWEEAQRSRKIARMPELMPDWL